MACEVLAHRARVPDQAQAVPSLVIFADVREDDDVVVPRQPIVHCGEKDSTRESSTCVRPHLQELEWTHVCLRAAREARAGRA